MPRETLARGMTEDMLYSAEKSKECNLSAYLALNRLTATKTHDLTHNMSEAP